jgi:hypothetical protein
MKIIELKVNDNTAEAISRMDSFAKEQLSKKLDDLISGRSRLIQIIQEIQKETERSGLTQKKLNKILNEV